MKIVKEIELIRHLVRFEPNQASLQIQEFCKNHNNVKDLNELKESLTALLPNCSTGLKRRIAIDLYWVIDKMIRLGNNTSVAEKNYLKHQYTINDSLNAWINTETVEYEYLYENDGKYEFMNNETYESVSIRPNLIQYHLPFLNEGDIVKFHYSDDGKFAGITL